MERSTSAHRLQLNASEEHRSTVGKVMRTHTGPHTWVQFAVGTDAVHDTINGTSLSHTTPTLNTTLSFTHASYQSRKLQDRSAHVNPVVAGRPAWSKLRTTGCLQILGTTERKLVATSTRRLVFVHPCCSVMFVSHCALSDGLRTLQCCSAIIWVCHVMSCHVTKLTLAWQCTCYCYYYIPVPNVL